MKPNIEALKIIYPGLSKQQLEDIAYAEQHANDPDPDHQEEREAFNERNDDLRKSK